MNKNVHISAGRMEQRERDGKKVEVYVEKVNVVVESDNLGALFRRDAELCALPIVRFTNTLESPNHGQFFAANRGAQPDAQE